MKKLFWLVGVLVLMSVPAFAQGGFLVPQDNSKEPCARFKMRVLIPSDTDQKMILRTPDLSLDPKMVFNPCTSNDPQLALFKLSPDQKGSIEYFFKGSDKPVLDPKKTVPVLVPPRSPRLTP
jgi:hypothetical protein